MPKTGVIDVGGGMRGMYAAGVFDRCLDDGVLFDVAIGISAGSANLASYTARQRGRNFAFYADYSFRKEYMSPGNLLRCGSYFDLDYVYSTLSNADGENPLDYPALAESATDFYVVAANALTGETVYFDRSFIAQDDYGIMKASSAIPVVSRPYEVRGVPYFDGALGDTVPVEKAFDLGCEKVVVVLTKPKDVERPVGKDAWMSALLRHRYPEAAERLATRAERYNWGVALAKALEKDGLALIVAPDDTCGVDTLAKDRAALVRLYRKGYEDGAAIAPFVAA